MKFTDEEFAFLSQHEERFQTAVYGDWARNPGGVILRQIHDLWNKKNKTNEILRESCAHCILALLKDVGKAYFADKKERETAKATEPQQEPKVESKKVVETKTQAKAKSATKAKKTKK